MRKNNAYTATYVIKLATDLPEKRTLLAWVPQAALEAVDSGMDVDTAASSGLGTTAPPAVLTTPGCLCLAFGLNISCFIAHESYFMLAHCPRPRMHRGSDGWLEMV